MFRTCGQVMVRKTRLKSKRDSTFNETEALMKDERRISRFKEREGESKDRNSIFPLDFYRYSTPKEGISALFAVMKNRTLEVPRPQVDPYRRAYDGTVSTLGPSS